MIIVFTAQCDPVQAESRCQLRLPRWLFVLPVPTWALVGWQMLLGTLTTGLTYAVLAGSIGYSLEVDWPIWIPAVVFSVAMAVVQAGAWALVGTPLLQFAWGLCVLSGLCVWANYRAMEATVLSPGELWSALGVGEWCILLLTGFGAYLVAVISVAGDRRGRPGILAWCARPASLLDYFTPTKRKFSSPQSAQFWMERRRMAVGRVGLFLLGLMFFAAIAGIVLSLLGIEMNNLTGGVFIVAVWISCLFQLGVVGYGTVSGVRDPSSFLATFPLSNTAWARAILKTNAASAGITLIIAVPIVMSIAFAMHQVLPYEPGAPLWRVGLWMGGISLIQWTLQGLAWPIKDFARRRFGAPVTFAGLLVTFIVVIAAARHFTRELAIVFGLAALVWTTATFVQSYRQGLIGRGVISVSVCLWLLLCLVLALVCLETQTTSVAVIVLFIGLLALPLAPLAAVPLVLQRFRHR